MQMFTMKKEVGILLLENLKLGESPMKMLDKTKLMTVDQIKVKTQTSKINYLIINCFIGFIPISNPQLAPLNVITDNVIVR